MTMGAGFLRLTLPAYIVFLMLTAHGFAQPVSGAQPHGNSPEQGNVLTTLTGILLVSDHRCQEWPDDVPRDKWGCPEGSSQWGLRTLQKQYAVWGNTNELKQYERRRVSVTGRLSTGPQSFIDRLDVESIRASEMGDSQIRDLIQQLRYETWIEPQNMSNPTSWLFHFTSPMLQILQAGPAAQDVLLQYVDDPLIKDRIIILLGGLGDGKAVAPIIRAMADRNEARDSAYARRVNLAANLALTNITVGDVIWHHGGGLTRDACPDDPKSCWYAWWIEHKDTFEVSKTANRNYSNYPSYGIYQSPGMFRSESFLCATLGYRGKSVGEINRFEAAAPCTDMR
jgi:hypothetical protein